MKIYNKTSAVMSIVSFLMTILCIESVYKTPHMGLKIYFAILAVWNLYFVRWNWKYMQKKPFTWELPGDANSE